MQAPAAPESRELAHHSPSVSLRTRLLALSALLAGEVLLLSLLSDFPLQGPSGVLAAGLRVLFPIAVAAVVAGWLLVRARPPDGRGPAEALLLPAWRPLPALALHLVAFAGTAGWAASSMAPGAAPPALGAFVAWLLCALGSAGLAVATVAPASVLRKLARDRWRVPAIALGLGVVVWMGAWATEQLWGGLSTVTLHAVVAVLSLFTDGVSVDPALNVIGLGDFAVEIAPVCSGADGIGLVFTFLACWIALARERLRARRALVLLPLGVAAAFAANILRVAVLVALGGSGHPGLAVEGFHSKLGWFLFSGIVLAGVAVAEHAPWFRRPAPGPAAAEGPAAGHLEEAILILPLLAALAAALATELFATGGVDLAYGLRLVAAGAALFAIRRRIPAMKLDRPVLAAVAGLALAGVWLAAVGGGPSPIPAALADLGAPWRAGWLALRLLGSVVVIPLAEELAFRGFLLRWLAGSPRAAPASWRAWPWLAILASGAAFGALHAELLLGTLAGVVLGVVYVRRGRLADAVLAHAACNAALAAAALLGGRWQLLG